MEPLGVQFNSDWGKLAQQHFSEIKDKVNFRVELVKQAAFFNLWNELAMSSVGKIIGIKGRVKIKIIDDNKEIHEAKVINLSEQETTLLKQYDNFFKNLKLLNKHQLVTEFKAPLQKQSKKRTKQKQSKTTLPSTSPTDNKQKWLTEVKTYIAKFAYKRMAQEEGLDWTEFNQGFNRLMAAFYRETAAIIDPQPPAPALPAGTIASTSHENMSSFSSDESSTSSSNLSEIPPPPPPPPPKNPRVNSGTSSVSPTIDPETLNKKIKNLKSTTETNMPPDQDMVLKEKDNLTPHKQQIKFNAPQIKINHSELEAGRKKLRPTDTNLAVKNNAAEDSTWINTSVLEVGRKKLRPTETKTADKYNAAHEPLWSHMHTQLTKRRQGIEPPKSEDSWEEEIENKIPSNAELISSESKNFDPKKATQPVSKSKNMTDSDPDITKKSILKRLKNAIRPPHKRVGSKKLPQIPTQSPLTLNNKSPASTQSLPAEGKSTSNKPKHVFHDELERKLKQKKQ